MSVLFKSFDHHFLESLKTVDNLSQLNTDLKNVFENIGIERFALTEITTYENKEITINYFSTYPVEWMDRYASEKYYEYDPVFKDPVKTPLPFCWDSTSFRGMTKQQQQLFDDAYDFNIRFGTTIPLMPGAYKSSYITILDSNLTDHFELMFFLRVVGNAYFNTQNKITNLSPEIK